MGAISTDNTVTKTIWQYSKPLPEETMAFLKGIGGGGDLGGTVRTLTSNDDTAL